MGETLLKTSGLAARLQEFDFNSLSRLPEQVPDVSRVAPGRQGGGVRLTSLLRAVLPSPKAQYMTLESDDGGFSASIPIGPVAERAIVVYRIGKGPLPVGKGGPVRFLIPDVAACGVDNLDSCANVKHLGRIELTERPGRDTRPSTEPEHQALHEAEGQR